MVKPRTDRVVFSSPPYNEIDHPQSTWALHSPPAVAYASNARHSSNQKRKLANRPKFRKN